MSRNKIDQEYSYYVNIKVYDKDIPSGNIIEYYKWDNMKFNQRVKWNWYFKYRTALLQVKYPRKYIAFIHGKEIATKKTLENILKDKISGKKRSITKVKNIIKEIENNWMNLFPLEDQPEYKLIKCKLVRLEEELQELQNEIL